MEVLQETSLPPQVFRKVVHDTIKMCFVYRKYIFTCSFNKHLENTCYVSNIVFDAGHPAVNKVGLVPALRELSVQWSVTDKWATTIQYGRWGHTGWDT